MGSGITIITPTGNRPEAFALCRKYVERQTLRPDQWIVVDDGEIRTEVPDWVTYLRREKQDNEPKHTLPLQMLEAIPFIDNDYIFIIEDDDWYSPKYLDTMIKYLEDYEMVGLSSPIYYHIKLGYMSHHKTTNATFCQTGFNKSMLGPVRDICNRICNPSIDLELWREHCYKKIIDIKPRISIGIKGMPGRLGTYSHTHGSYKKDPEHRFLKSHIGKDIELYAPYFV